MNDSTQIKCPNCGTSIDVQDILAHQLEDEIKRKYQSQLVEERKKHANAQQEWGATHAAEIEETSNMPLRDRSGIGKHKNDEFD